MVVYWAMMVYEITEAETLVRYIVHHDTDAELVFRIIVQPIVVKVSLSTIREEHLDGIYTTFRVLYTTSTNVQVTLSWV